MSQITVDSAAAPPPSCPCFPVNPSIVSSKGRLSASRHHETLLFCKSPTHRSQVPDTCRPPSVIAGSRCLFLVRGEKHWDFPELCFPASSALKDAACSTLRAGLQDVRPAAGGAAPLTPSLGSTEDRDDPGPGGRERHLQHPRLSLSRGCPVVPTPGNAGRRGARWGGVSVAVTCRF